MPRTPAPARRDAGEHGRTRGKAPATGSGRTITVAGVTYDLADIPTVGYTLGCGHVERNIAVQVGDWMFCDPCADRRRVEVVHD